jgi:hypothetical protein
MMAPGDSVVASAVAMGKNIDAMIAALAMVAIAMRDFIFEPREEDRSGVMKADVCNERRNRVGIS